MFIGLASHYLRTPITVMQGAADIAVMQGDTPQLWQAVKAQVAALHQKAEEMIAQSSKDLASIDDARAGENFYKEHVRIWLRPLFIIPVAVVGTIAFGFNVIVVQVTAIDLSLILWMAQIIVFVLLSHWLFVTVSNYVYSQRRRQRAVMEREQQASIDRARGYVIEQGASSLAAIVKDINKKMEALAGEKPKMLLSDGSGRLGRMISHFVTAEQLAIGKAASSPQEFPLQKVIREATGQSALAANEKGVMVEIPEGEYSTYSQPQWLERVFASVIDNAVAYSPAGGKVLVKVQSAGGRTVVKISDNGPGISKEKLELLFQPFTRAEDVTNFSHEGMGFSLYLDRLIMLYVGGDISMRSEVGGGTEVTVAV